MGFNILSVKINAARYCFCCCFVQLIDVLMLSLLRKVVVVVVISVHNFPCFSQSAPTGQEEPASNTFTLLCLSDERCPVQSAELLEIKALTEAMLPSDQFGKCDTLLHGLSSLVPDSVIFSNWQSHFHSEIPQNVVLYTRKADNDVCLVHVHSFRFGSSEPIWTYSGSTSYQAFQRVREGRCPQCPPLTKNRSNRNEKITKEELQVPDSLVTSPDSLHQRVIVQVGVLSPSSFAGFQYVRARRWGWYVGVGHSLDYPADDFMTLGALGVSIGGICCIEKAVHPSLGVRVVSLGFTDLSSFFEAAIVDFNLQRDVGVISFLLGAGLKSTCPLKSVTLNAGFGIHF